MLGLTTLSLWATTKRAELEQRRSFASGAAANARVAESLANNLYIDVDKLIGDGGCADLTVPLNMSIEKQRTVARRLVETSAHAKNILNLIVNFTIGNGFSVKLKDEGHANQWKKDAKRLRWKRRVREMVRRIVRDGEQITRRFGGEQKDLRFVEPGFVRNPHIPPRDGGPILDGVQVAADDEGGVDFETAVAYWIANSPSGDSESVDASEIFHSKQPDTDLTETRGRPPLYDATPDIQNYDEWLRYRRLLNKARTHLAFIRKHKGSTPSQIQNFANSVKDGTINRRHTTGGIDRLKYLVPGVGVDVDENTELEFPKANLDSRDAAKDGRSMRLLIAVWFSFAEYMVTGDASNANFSSTLVAETPAIKAMQSWQEFVGDELRRFFAWWFDDDDIEVDFTWPTMVGRDREKETKANETMHSANIMSTATWQEREGLDPDVETARLAVTGQADATTGD